MGSLAPESRLFSPLRVGKSNLSHRMVMAPLTRFRADDSNVPMTPLVPEYYAQRASVPGTLLITEATFIAPKASGYPNVPGIWNQAQIDAWKKVTDAVHAKGSYIYVQLWALGRVAQPAVLEKVEGGPFDLHGASPIPAEEGKAAPRELSVDEIKEYTQLYAQAAKNAIAAGFDGVEIHSANGYLLDQFVQDVSNQRTDNYGGSIENRSRFGLEVAAAIADAIGPERVGIRISPYSKFQGMKMEDPKPQFTHYVKGLKTLKLGYLHVVESRVHGIMDTKPEENESIRFVVDAWENSNPLIVAGGFTPARAKEVVEEYKDDDIVVAFGRHFISTPDLPFRIQEGIELNDYNRDTFYKAKSAEGYTDYPFSEQWESVKGKL